MTKAFFFDVGSSISNAIMNIAMIDDHTAYRLIGKRYYVVFQHKPVVDPMFDDEDMSEEEVERLWPEHEDFMMVVRGAVAGSDLDILSSYYLMKDCIASGYDEEKHGTYVMAWITHTVACAIKEWEEVHGVCM